MKNRNDKYWASRAKERMMFYHKNSDKTIQTITKAYDKAIEDIEKEIQRMFIRFIRDGELTTEQAIKILNERISSRDLDGIRELIPSIEDDETRRYLISQLNAPAYRARMTRLEALKEILYIQTKRIADVEIRASTTQYMDTIKQAYYRSIFDIHKGLGLGFQFAAIPAKTIEQILKNPWSGKHFSERIWDNTDVLAEKLTEIITSGLMSGKSYYHMAKELEEYTEYGKYAAMRLVRTESTYMANMAALESYKECGIEKYIYVATLDNRTSEVCQKLDRKVFEVSKAEPGKNFPPMHPNCRSTTRSYISKEELAKIKRRARDPKTGKTYLIPADMDYKEWYQKYVVDKYGKDPVEVMEKKILNKASDKKQYKKYKEVLGKDMPNSFDKFQDLKYNKSEDYRFIKLDYSRRNKLINNPDLKLPNVEKATIAEDKFTKYLFGGNNLKGLPKGELITKRLGYDINNYKEFEKEIKDRSLLNPANYLATDKYGDKYEQKIVMYGKFNKPTNVIVGWKVKDDKTHLTSTYIKEVKGSED